MSGRKKQGRKQGRLMNAESANEGINMINSYVTNFKNSPNEDNKKNLQILALRKSQYSRGTVHHKRLYNALVNVDRILMNHENDLKHRDSVHTELSEKDFTQERPKKTKTPPPQKRPRSKRHILMNKV